ncbi:MAG: ComF family protein [Candidatus Acidiferrales bacterium]
MAISIVRGVADALASVLFPAPCQICGAVLTNASTIPICAACFASLQSLQGPLCVCCGRPFVSEVTLDAKVPKCFACRREVYAFECARSFGAYTDQMVRAIGLLKYEKLTRLGQWFAERLHQVIQADPALRPVDVVVPVPLHPARLRERGYNQAELIAKPLARKLRLPLGPYLLVRTKPRPPRLLLSRRERWLTVRGAYEIRKGARVDNLRVLLIDDVFTTGATLDACARALQKAGAKSVIGLTVARAILQTGPDATNLTRKTTTLRAQSASKGENG